MPCPEWDDRHGPAGSRHRPVRGAGPGSFRVSFQYVHQRRSMPICSMLQPPLWPVSGPLERPATSSLLINASRDLVSLQRWNGLLLPCGIIVPTVKRPLEGQGKEESRWSIRPSLSISQSRCFRWRCRIGRGTSMRSGGSPRDRFFVLRTAAAGDDRLGGLRVRALLGAPAPTVRPHGAAACRRTMCARYVRRNKTDRTDAKGAARGQSQ